ncbi:MAG: bifunctional glutamate N-acetyltransferase/amino-acid acetyltransferase ArgJ [Microthrixaceae bacterium]
MDFPPGFAAHVGHIGIRDDSTDFAVVACSNLATASARFTRSRFAGPSVEVSRQAVANERLRAVVVVSKNANVATGVEGLAHANELAQRVGGLVGGAPDDVLVASTGVIGRPYPMDRVRDYLDGLAAESTWAARFPVTDAAHVARAMMTTDTVAKVAEATVGDCRVVGVAKGVGMIEPDMATMLAFVFTDAELPAAELDRIFGGVVDRTFNSLSVDTDTSTSDTAAVLASGLGGPVEAGAFEAALETVCLDLTRQLAADGEGAETLIVVRVEGARDDDQARRAAKAVVNSPLVKTAVHGADPNWGRVVMAIGKLADDTDIDPDSVVVCFGAQEVYPHPTSEAELDALSAYMGGDEVHIGVNLGIADGSWTVYGCDLTDGYVRINADYTT